MGQDKPFDISEFSKKGEAFYETIKDELESKYLNKFAAIDFETKQYWIGESASDALK